MRFVPTKLAGAFVVEPEPRGDERGFFARTYCRDEFTARGATLYGVSCDATYSQTAFRERLGV